MASATPPVFDLDSFQEDADTIVRCPLPELVLPLRRRTDDWVGELPAGARQVLEQARRCSAGWPYTPRPLGAVATPVAHPSFGRGMTRPG